MDASGFSLGANDGITSLSSLAIGVTAASSTRDPFILTGKSNTGSICLRSSIYCWWCTATFVILFVPMKGMEYWLYGFTIVFLGILGAASAKSGGSSIKKAVLSVIIWGTIAMGLSAFVGYLFSVHA